MSVDQMEVGMEWVTSRLAAFAREAGLEMQAIGWDATTEDFKANRHSLAVLMNGKREVVTFHDSDLEEMSADDTVQTAIENQLRMFVESKSDR